MPVTEGFAPGDMFVIIGIKVHDDFPSARDTEWCMSGTIVPFDKYKKIADPSLLVEYFLKKGVSAVIKKVEEFHSKKKGK